MSNESNKITFDVTSKILEDGLDIAKKFLERLIGPTIDEVGLLIKEKLALYRFQNQIKILNKAKDYCEKSQINPKMISLKLLCPLLDYSSLDEEDYLQDKWALLLSNMVDSQQNIDNHVFPYILSQVSIQELRFLEEFHFKRIADTINLTMQLESLKLSNQIKLTQAEQKLTAIKLKINMAKEDHDLTKEHWKLESTLYSIKREINASETKLLNQIRRLQFIDLDELAGYEVANLIRLGIIKAIARPFANTSYLEIPNDPEKSYLTVDFEVEIESDTEEHAITELGDVFLKACNQKNEFII